MAIEDLREEISKVISDDKCGAEFYFLLKSDDGFELRRADLDGEAQLELAASFIESVTDSILLEDDVSLVDLSSADDRSNAIYLYDIDAIPEQLVRLSDVLEGDDFELFDFSKDSLERLKGIIVLLGHGSEQLVLYKHQYPIALFKRDTGLFVKAREKNRLEKVPEDILRITKSFEFFKIGDNYYILDIKALERFFGFHQAIMNLAREGLHNVIESNIVENPSVFEDRMEDISFARKLVKASRASPVLGEIPNVEVVAFVSSHPALKGKIKTSEDGTQLSLETKVSQDLFLKLLNDDFLQSELTKRHYASVAKDAVE